MTYWLGFELREQKSILFILLEPKKTKPNNERIFEAKYKLFLFCSFLLSRSPTVKEAGEIDADNLKLKTFHPCIFSFQCFIALKTISTFLERYLIRTYSMLYRIIVAQMCRIKQNFKNHTRFLYSSIEHGERVFVVWVLILYIYI